MIWLSVALAQDVAEAPEVGEGHALYGNRLDADGVGSSVGIGEAFVLGSDGGVLATTAAVRFGAESWSFAAVVPFASYRTAAGRTTGLGNVRFEGYHRFSSGGALQLVGAELHLPSSDAWTWANDAQSLWPGDLLLRGSLGLHGTPGVAPFPSFYLHVAAVGGYELDLPVEGLSVLSEVALSVWDPSPIDAAGWVSWQPLDGLRVRGGLLLPLGSWVGLSPGDKPAGLREGTFSLDLSMRLR